MIVKTCPLFLTKNSPMIVALPPWPYLLLQEDIVLLLEPDPAGAEQEPGDYCGEWGSHLGAHGEPIGIRIHLYFDHAGEGASEYRARNVQRAGDDLLVYFRDSRLPAAEGCPLLPVYRAALPDGSQILQLSGL